MLRMMLIIAIACGCSAALAQKKMYRCGNQFQERPCEGPKAGAAASSAANVDPQQQQESAARRRERERTIHQAKCENYADELADIDRRIKAGADRDVVDQFKRRQKEMRNRIERVCK